MSSNSANQETISFDREKWESERSFREREITVKEREQAIRQAELKLKSKEFAKSGWRSPLVIAIIVATIAAVGNGVITVVNGLLQRQLEDQKSEQTRILEMIKTDHPDKAAENLEFLLNAGLVNDEKQVVKLREFLAKREPGSGPSLPISTGGIYRGGIVGADDATLTNSLPSNSLIRTSARAVGQLLVTVESGPSSSQCTAFLVGDSLALTAGFCVEDISSARLMMLDQGKEIFYEVELPAVEIISGVDGLNYALLNVKGSPGLKHGILRLASQEPKKDQALALIMFRATKQQLVISSASDCRVLEVEKDVFHHLCDTGPGASGAPILTADGSQVLGMHFRRDTSRGTAVRGDALLNVSGILQRTAK